jgi:chromosome segregation ATPase
MLHTYLIRAVLVLGGLALIVAGWWLYDLGKLHGADELRSLRTRHGVLEKRHDKLLGDSKELREKVAILQRSSQIDRQAALDVKADLAKLEEELQAAREEISSIEG